MPSRETIKQRIAASKEKYDALRKINQEKRQAKKEFKAMVHAGNEWYCQNENKIKLGALDLGNGFIASWAVIAEEDTDTMECTWAYSIKSSTDEYNQKTAIGICCYRLMMGTIHSCHWLGEFSIPKMIWFCAEEFVGKLINSQIEFRIGTLSPEIPQRLINDLYSGVEKEYKRKLRLEDLTEDLFSAFAMEEYEAVKEIIATICDLKGGPTEYKQSVLKAIDLIKENPESFLDLKEAIAEIGKL